MKKWKKWPENIDSLNVKVSVGIKSLESITILWIDDSKVPYLPYSINNLIFSDFEFLLVLLWYRKICIKNREKEGEDEIEKIDIYLKTVFWNIDKKILKKNIREEVMKILDNKSEKKKKEKQKKSKA